MTYLLGLRWSYARRNVERSFKNTPGESVFTGQLLHNLRRKKIRETQIWNDMESELTTLTDSANANAYWSGINLGRNVKKIKKLNKIRPHVTRVWVILLSAWPTWSFLCLKSCQTMAHYAVTSAGVRQGSCNFARFVPFKFEVQLQTTSPAEWHVVKM